MRAVYVVVIVTNYFVLLLKNILLPSWWFNNKPGQKELVGFSAKVVLTSLGFSA
jgi:hypothetical protein